MQRVDIPGQLRRSVVMIGEPLGNLPSHAAVERLIIVTDETVFKLYGQSFPPVPVIRIASGEACKTLDTVSLIYRGLLEQEADRGSCLVAVGGGLVCDVAGFAASTYLRGIAFGCVPTTLLAQVDASVGGKNGVNFDGYKNMIGTFNQPEFVLCDPDLLHSLPPEEIGCGLAEIVKHAAIADQGMFELLEDTAEAARRLDRPVIERLICESVRIKASIVTADERESGERRKLNFGHTFGHAVERLCSVPHGRAVAQGMAVASALSVQRGYLSEEGHQRLLKLLGRLDLPVRLDADPQELLPILAKDKKRLGESIHFVLLESIGKAVVEPIDLEEIKTAAERLTGNG